MSFIYMLLMCNAIDKSVDVTDMELLCWPLFYIGDAIIAHKILGRD